MQLSQTIPLRSHSFLGALSFDKNGNPTTGITPGNLFNYDSSDLTWVVVVNPAEVIEAGQ